MKNKIEDAFINLKKIFRFDFENLANIKDFIIINEKELDDYITLMRNEINNISKATYTISINSNYLIILHKIKEQYKPLKQFFLEFKKIIIDLNELDKFNINALINLVLIISPEFYTLYNIKRQIATDKNAEFTFINTINNNNRKCSISWNYRLHLMGSLMSDNFLEYDLMLLQAINDKDKRNYHLWKYVISISRLYKDQGSRLKIFNFCVNNFLKDTFDYSAYSCSVNLIRTIDHTVKNEILDKILLSQNIINAKSEYLESFIKLLNK
jgi:hypothetical protein